MKQKPYLWLIALITANGTMGIHMFLPALPLAAADLGTETGLMQMTISVYIMGLAVGQLIYGPLSDAWGRRRVLIYGLSIYVLGSTLATIAPSIEILLCARAIQSLGACAGVTLGRAIIRDTSTDLETARNLGIMTMLMAVSPIVAPMVGGVVTAVFGWRANFIALGLLCAGTLSLVILLLPETARPSGALRMRGVMTDYKKLLSTRHFICFVLGGGLITTSQFGFLASMPFIVTHQLNQSIQTAGLYSGLVLIGAASGNGISSSLSYRFKPEFLLRAGIGISLVSGAIFVFIATSGHLSGWTMVGVVTVFTFGQGIANPPAMGQAMTISSGLFGSAAGLWGCSQMVAGALNTTLTAIGKDPASAAAIVMLSCIVLAMVLFEAGFRCRPTPRKAADKQC